MKNKNNMDIAVDPLRCCIICLLGSILTLWTGFPGMIFHGNRLQAAIYYVSSSSGRDSNNGLSEETPFETIEKVNTLDLQPGDSVLFKCGDTWRTEMLIIAQSGTAGNLITFNTYPRNCGNPPILSGAQPISNWIVHDTNIYVANLRSGENLGRFAYGVNQLFRNGQRLPMGRWPNLDMGDNGYSVIDGQLGNHITDNELPDKDWTGAIVHIKGMRWYILNREVTDHSGQILTLGSGADCWNGCVGWGFFLNRHLGTLDREGEWFFDIATNKIYLYTSRGVPVNGEIEGSVLLKNDDRSWGGVTLGKDLNAPGISYCVVENLDIRRWFRHGIATPTNYAHYESHDIALKNNTISDVDGIGINLASWVWSAEDGRPDGWRGGYHMLIEGNTIDTVNRVGINLYSRNSTINDNVVRNVGRIENLGAAGLGCDLDDGGGLCTEDGDGIRVKVDKADDTGNNNIFKGNLLEHIGYNGFDIFGYGNTLEQNIIRNACYTKGDCGAIRTFGRDNLMQSAAHDLVFKENIIEDTIGNTDGCQTDYKSLFGFGFYIDHYSRDIALTDNTVINSTMHGILYQNSTGTINGNTLYDNGNASTWAAQVWLSGVSTYVSNFTNNILYGRNNGNWTLALDNTTRLGHADQNYYFSPYNAEHIHVEGNLSLSSWQSVSGKDGDSTEAWFSSDSDDAFSSTIFYNDTTQNQAIGLNGLTYLDIDQNIVAEEITLQPFMSRILISTLKTEIEAPSLFLEQERNRITFRWSEIDGSHEYIITYASYPNAESIGYFSMQTQTELSFTLWPGAAFYVAVQARKGEEISSYSNIEYFQNPENRILNTD